MAKLISDFFCVAVAGPTIDGREINAAWLKDMGDTYDASLYEAMIWYEHFRFTGNYGAIYAAKWEKGSDGLIRLYNRLIPSPMMLELNQQGQKLHSSIEVLTEFRGKKKAYQYGLGITDSPASVGTDKLAFSAGIQYLSDEARQCVDGICKTVMTDKINAYKMRVPGVPQEHLEIFIAEPLPDLEFSKERKIFDFGGLFGRKSEQTTDKEPDDMTKDETTALFKELLAEAQGELVNAIKAEFNTQPPAVVTPPAPAVTVPPAPAADAPKFASEDSVKTLETKMTEVTGALEKLTAAMDKIPAAGGGRSEADGSEKTKPKW